MVKTPFAFAAVLSAAVSLAALAAPAIAQAPATAIPTDEYRLPEFGGWGFNPAAAAGSVETYEGLVITPGQALANNVSVGDWAWKDQLSDLAEPVDKAKWLMTPQTVKAYYMPPANEIVFPAAFLQPPDFNAKADPAVNYGAIAAVVRQRSSLRV